MNIVIGLFALVGTLAIQLLVSAVLLVLLDNNGRHDELWKLGVYIAYWVMVNGVAFAVYGSRERARLAVPFLFCGLFMLPYACHQLIGHYGKNGRKTMGNRAEHGFPVVLKQREPDE